MWYSGTLPFLCQNSGTLKSINNEISEIDKYVDGPSKNMKISEFQI